MKDKVKEAKSKLGNLVNEYGTRNNIFKALGIIAGVGAGVFLAVKYVPWNTVADKLEDGLEMMEEAFNKAFQETVPSQPASTEATV